MMKYDIALTLKTKGFPQRGWGFRACEHNKEALKHVQACDCQMADLVSVPGLSELIRECNPTGKWAVIIFVTDKICTAAQQGIAGQGESPEEAVADLWLLKQNHGNIQSQ